MTIEPIDAGRTRMSIESHFPSTEAMEQVLGMGMEEGLTEAVGQIDAILAEDAVAPHSETHPRSHHDHDHRAHHPHARGARRRPDLRHPEDRLHHRPVLFLIGSPMGAGGFATLASHFPDRTIVTYDPRGVERSVKADPASVSTPDQHADDLHRVIAAVGAGPVDLFASSGGAVNALALVAKHPEQVRTLVAHEPPLASIVPGPRGCDGVHAGDQRHLRAQRVRAGHGAVHPAPSATEGR